MNTVAFDTLKFSERLQSGGFTPEQSKVVSYAFAEATGEQLVTRQVLKDELAPIKQEFAKIRQEMKEEFANVRQEMQNESVNVKQEFFSVRQDMQKESVSVKQEFASVRQEIALVKADVAILKWMSGFTLAALMAILYLLLRQH